MITLAVLSAGSTLHGLRPCAEAFMRMSGITVTVATDHGHNIEADVRRGTAQADVVLLPADRVAALTAEGLVAADGQGALGKVGIGAVARAGAPLPQVGTMDGLRGALQTASSVLVTRAPTGEHMLRVIAQLGLAEAVAAKLVQFDTATLLIKHLAAEGDAAALGFSPAAEILVWRDRGVAFAGPLPDEIQVALPYAAAMLTRTRASESALALLGFLATPQARTRFHESGVV